MIKASLLSAIVLVSSIAVSASQVNMSVSPRTGVAPVDLFIYVSAERHADNRMLRVTAESSDFFRSSEVPLDGEDGPRVTVFHFQQLPSGSYDIRADLIGSKGETREATRCEVEVL